MSATTNNAQQHLALITKFYSAFSRLDSTTMSACYHPQATFKDEAFDLTGKDIGAMWSMLCSQAQEFSLEFSGVECLGDTGKAHWEPTYLFSMTGNKVHNIIDAEFEFRDGLIYRHRDHFNFWRWSKQALGLVGTLLGWSGLLKAKVQTTANKNLQRYISKQATTQNHKT
jgi:ketosteroid isomerase-like protein